MRRKAAPLMLAVMLFATTRTAAADVSPAVRSCIDEHEHAQAAMKDGKLRRAREGLLQCASKQCPALVSEDCTRLVGEVELALPTIVPSAERAGVGLTDVRVFTDGELVLERLHGTAIPVDPGEHVVAFVTPEGQSVERRIVVNEGQKRVIVSATFAPVAAVSSSPAGGSDRPARSITGAPLVLGAIAIAGAATFAGFGLSGKADERELERTCGTACEPTATDPIRTKYLVADISLGVSIVAAVAAVWTYLVQRPAAH